MLERITIVFTKEVVDNLRDRRTVLVSLLYPLLGPILLALLFFLLAGIISEQTEEPLPLPTVGRNYAPALISFLTQHNVEIQVAPDDPERAVREGDEDVVLLIPEGYAETWREGRPATIQLVIDRSRQSASPAIQRLQRLLERYSQQIGAQRLLLRGISPSVVSPLAIEDLDLSTPQSQAANLLNMAPYFIILAVFIGGMYLAIDTTTGERERGSLEPLLLNPIPRWELVIGKLGATLLFTLFVVIETLIAFGLLLNYAPINIPLSFGPEIFLTIFLITIPMMLLAASLQLLVATFTRSFKEAQNYISLIALVPALPGMFLAFAPIKATIWTMLIPTFGQQLLINQVMRGDVVDPIHLILSAVLTLIVALLLVIITVKLYDRESVLFR
jgi:sodium transport system permease protein